MSTSNLTDWPTTYTKIRFSGQGSSAKVYLAVSRTHLSAAVDTLVSQDEARTEEIITQLCSQIIAVKVSTAAPIRHNGRVRLPDVSSTRTAMNNERLNLENIHNMISHPHGRKHVVSLVDYDPAPSDPRWIVTETMPSSCDLSTLLRHTSSAIPPALVLSVFVQASQGLLYMQQRSKSIGHGDIKLDNLLIGFHNEDPGTMPDVKIIDFGYAAEDPDAGQLDTASLVDVIITLSNRCGRPNSGTTGCNVLDVFRAVCRQRRYQDLAQLWAKMGPLALAKLTAIDSEECQEINNLVHLAVLEKYGGLRGQVWRLLLEEVKATAA